MEDEVELAHILERPVEALNEDLDEVEDTQLALGPVHHEAGGQRRDTSPRPPFHTASELDRLDLHKVERRIVAVNDTRVVVPSPRLGSSRQRCSCPLRRGRRRRGGGEDELGRVEEVAYASRAVRDEREDLRDEGLLLHRRDGGVELGQPGFA